MKNPAQFLMKIDIPCLVVLSNYDWQGNLDAFNDLLRGGFGTPEGGLILVWLNSEASRINDWRATTMTIPNNSSAKRITVQIPTTSGDAIEGGVFLPEGTGPHPAVVMAHGIGGI